MRGLHMLGLEKQKTTKVIATIGQSLPNIPWEEKPEDCKGVVWRYSNNPVIPRDLLPNSNSIFNSAVVPYDGTFAGVFRCDDTRRKMMLHVGKSTDGISWQIDEKPIKFICEDTNIGTFKYGYDPRVCWIEDRYYLTWCNWYHAPTIGVAYTFDFETFYQVENAFLPFNRNGVLFPRKINNKFFMLSRPSGPGANEFGDLLQPKS
jgi:beta-1,4-mannooligosaccharide/beta-1,4-mannosyl-N-acetylglucosamine phosphorylase